MEKIKIISISDLDNKGWQDYFELTVEIDKKFGTGEPSDENYEEFKTSRLKDCQRHNAREFLLLEDNKPCAWFAIKRDTRSSSFIFDSVNDEASDGEIHAIFNEVYSYITEFNIDTSYHWSFNPRCNNMLKKAGAVINEELITTRLERNEMNLSVYNNIVSSTDWDGYRLKLFTSFPVDIVDNFTLMMNEIFAGMNKLNPYGVKIEDRTSEFWLKKYKYEGEDGSQMKMFMLFGKDNNIAAYCSLFVDKDNPLRIRHEGGFTVVAPAHRGKGFARYLKAKMYLMLLEENKKFTFITTDTMPWNTYMYSINEEFDFKPFEHGVDYKITKEFLKNYLGNQVKK